jgi:putative DNA primase/helicase
MRRRGADEEDILVACLSRAHKKHEVNDKGELLTDAEVRKAAKSISKKGAASFLLTETANHEGNAQCVAKLFGKDYLHCYEAGWMHYTGTHWERDDKTLTRDVVRTLRKRRVAVAECPPDMYKGVYTGAKETRPNVMNTMGLLQSILPVKWDEFDRHPDLLNCANGVLNLRTGKMTPHDRSQRFTYCVATEYHADADPASWVAFLSGVVDDGVRAEALDYLQLAMGYSITGHTSEEVLFYLFGPTRSGKGTFIETLKKLLGSLGWEVAFSTFSGRRRAGDQNFDLAPLRSCRFVAASEGDRTVWLNAAFIKRITGGNSVQASFKHQTPFNYRPCYKIWLSSNYEPSTDPGDDGVWGRLKVIRFPNSFLGTEDKSLKARLGRPECLEGVLAWLVEGAVKWYALGRHGLRTPPFVQRVVTEARTKVDSVQQWARDCLESDEGGFVGNERYFASYRAWCERRDFKPRGLRTVTADLARLNYVAGQQKDYVLDKKSRGLVGVKVVEESAKTHGARMQLGLEGLN